MTDNRFLISKTVSTFSYITSLIGEFTSEKEINKIFGLLSEIFCVSGADGIDAVSEKLCDRLFSEMNDISSCNRAYRILELSGKSDGEGFSSLDKEILSCKREALCRRAALNKLPRHATAADVVTSLENAAEYGDISAISTLAFFKYHGITAGKDRACAKSLIHRGAEWNDVFSLLMGIAFDTDSRAEYLGILRTSLDGEIKASSLGVIQSVYGFTLPDCRNDNALILAEAFAKKRIDMNRTDEGVLRVLRCRIMTPRAKRALLLAASADSFREITAFPCNVPAKSELKADISAIDALSVSGKNGNAEIKENLASVGIRKYSAYKPLNIVCRDAYLLKKYEDAVCKAFSGCQTVKLDGMLLGGDALSYTRDNVFLNALDRTGDAGTVFIIENCDMLDAESLHSLTCFLKGAASGELRFVSPEVYLDFSGILPILFSGEKLSGESGSFFECVTVNPVRPDEKPEIIRELLSEYSVTYGMERVPGIPDSCVERLSGLSLKKIGDILNRVVRSMAAQGVICDVTPDELLKYSDGGAGAFGFFPGGGKHGMNNAV